MKICILGSEDNLYTNIVTKHFDDLEIDYFLILVKKRKSKKNNILSRVRGFLNSKKYIALSKLDPFTYKLVYQSIKYKKSNKYNDLIKKYVSYKSKCKNTFYTPEVNHPDTINIIKINNFDIGVLGGVGIVKNPIIKSFKKYCINAHPAPLPECKGGGALENTLYYNLKPTVSVHYAIPKVDSGDILYKREVLLEKNDCFNHIHTKLLILCGKSLSEVVLKIINKVHFTPLKNIGELKYWKDCNKKVRIQGLANLIKIKNNL